ncbi:MAG: hypothetical protein KIT83_09645, partial [Bryobacterales bacterium]|nr:hypothetical protein [Bryobacterales bacterium]
MMKKFFSPLIVVAICFLSVAIFSAQNAQAQKESVTKREALYPSLLNEVIPHITKGGNWTSKFVLFNVGTASKPYKMVFYNSSGQPTSIPLKDRGSVAEVFGFLQPGASVWFETQQDSSPTETQYWSRLTEGTGAIQGYVIFSWSVPGNTPMEVTVPLTNDFMLYPAYVPFNNTGGYKTALALTNTYNQFSFGSAQKVTIEAIDTNGNMFFSTELSVDAGHKTAFLLPDRYPALQNQRGTLRIKRADAIGVYVSFIALQFHPS